MAILFGSRVRENFDRLEAAAVVEAPDTAAAAGVRLSPSGELFIDDLFVTTAVADSVPSYRRAKVLIGSSISNLSLRQRDAAGNLLPSIPFLRKPDPDRITSALLADTVFDLADNGVAYWFNPNYGSPAGWRYNAATGPARKHASVRYLSVDDVVEVEQDSYIIRDRIPGDPEVRSIRVPAYAVVGFECAAGNWLRTGSRAITTARLLEDAARLYARTPNPQTILKNTGPRKTAEQVEELLSALEHARSSRSTAYVGRDLDLQAFGFDATQIALSDARSAAVLDIARVTGVPPIYLGQGIADATMTYQNATSARIDLHAAMLPFITAIEQRLSFDDVTGNGVSVEFDVTPFLRVDPTMRATLYSTLIPLGVLTVDEARAMENLTIAEGTSK